MARTRITAEPDKRELAAARYQVERAKLEASKPASRAGMDEREADQGRIAVGQEIRVRADAFPEKTLPGKLVRSRLLPRRIGSGRLRAISVSTSGPCWMTWGGSDAAGKVTPSPAREPSRSLFTAFKGLKGPSERLRLDIIGPRR